jgi:Na+-transporting methylmalonyl-CoA/oxaloacetate decarboxylase gamma subunit
MVRPGQVLFIEREETDTVSWINGWWQQVSGTAVQGLQVTIVGMSLVFLTLGLIILVLALLTHLPGLRAKRDEQEQPAEPTGRMLAAEPIQDRATNTSPIPDHIELAQVAAIAVALVRSQQPTRQPTRAATAASKWKQYGRAHQLGL